MAKSCKNFARARPRYKKTDKFGIPKYYGRSNEVLAKGQFIDAIRDSDMRLEIKQARPTDLNDAGRHSAELQVFSGADKKMQQS